MLTKNIIFRVSESEHALLKQLAGKESLTSYIKNKIFPPDSEEKAKKNDPPEDDVVIDTSEFDRNETV